MSALVTSAESPVGKPVIPVPVLRQERVEPGALVADGRTQRLEIRAGHGEGVGASLRAAARHLSNQAPAAGTGKFGPATGSPASQWQRGRTVARRLAGRSRVGAR
jgi:hypothetical protein